MTILTKCSVCKKNRLFTKTWTYQMAPYGKITSDSELCYSCNRRMRLLVLGKWSLRHYLGYFWFRITNLFKKS